MANRERDTGLEGTDPPSTTPACAIARPDATAPVAIAVEFLEAVRAGDDRAVDLAARLAETVLDTSAAYLAMSVTEGGPLAITRAIRLAEHVLSTATAAAGRLEGRS
jgi:hypothetical protein